MEHLTPEQRCEIIKIYYQNQSSVKATWRGLRAYDMVHINDQVNKQFVML